MSQELITVLYEDRQARGEKNYGPHMLLLACVVLIIGGSAVRWLKLARAPRAEAAPAA